MERLAAILSLALLPAMAALAQPARTFIVGNSAAPWEGGGNGIDPKVVIQGRLDTTNAPGNAIEFLHKPGWISPLYFNQDENIAARVLEGQGSIRSPDVGRGYEEQLEGTVNGSHTTAFQRKPTLFEPEVNARGIRIILDFFVPVGVHRVRFYPRNTVVPAASTPFHADFLRGYELWLNPESTSLASPDVLIARNAENQDPIVDIAVPPQYVRILMLKSLANVPFEIDEIEVYGTGYLKSGTYLTDILDLGDRATIGPIRWAENSVGEPEFSSLSVRARTGQDPTPLLYRRLVRGAQPEEVSPDEYFRLPPRERAPFAEDLERWSPWNLLDNGQLITAPTPTRYVQFQLEFAGGLFTTRQVDQLEFDFLVPPIADGLTAEVFPRLAQAEKPATFRYAVRLSRQGQIRGFDRLEVDTNVGVTQIREVKLDGEPLEFSVDFVRDDAFGIRFPLITSDQALIEFTFDLPIFRFGTTFSGRAYNSRAPGVPQALSPGHAVRFGPGDEDELSGLSVSIPRPQIGKLVGEIRLHPRVFTPNGDGVNDRLEIFFNILQLTRAAPVSFALYDLSGRRVHTLFSEERDIGPLTRTWDGRLADGSLTRLGTYIWVLEIDADAFAERHTGTLVVAY